MKDHLKFMYKAVLVNLFIAALMWSWMNGFRSNSFEFLFDSDGRYILFGIALLIPFTYLLGRLMFYLVHERGCNGFTVGPFGALLILSLSVALPAAIAFIFDYMKTPPYYQVHFWEGMWEYVGGSLLLILVFGGIPTVISGLVIGWKMRVVHPRHGYLML